jgi:hypothetical protein
MADRPHYASQAFDRIIFRFGLGTEHVNKKEVIQAPTKAIGVVYSTAVPVLWMRRKSFRDFSKLSEL